MKPIAGCRGPFNCVEQHSLMHAPDNTSSGLHEAVGTKAE
jgi:hypothetical protein